MASAPSQRSDSPRTDKRARITEAAISVFAEKGFHAARISDVAKRASVADGTIYLYFKNKDHLLLSIFEEKMDELLEGLAVELDGRKDPVERLLVCARFHFDQLRRNPELAQVFQVELRQSRKFLQDYRPEKLWQYLGVFGRIIEEAKDAGLIRADVDTFVARWAFFGALDELAIQWVLTRNRDRFNLDKAAEQVVEIFLRGMAAGADPRRGQ